MAGATPRRTALSLFKELLLTRAISVLTPSEGFELHEKAQLDAVTVIQLDGDVINYIREGAPLDRHFAALRQVSATLRLARACWLGVERSTFWTLTLGGQYLAHGWLFDALFGGAQDWRAELSDVRHIVSSLAGFALPFVLGAGKLALREFVRSRLERLAHESPQEVLSGRPKVTAG